MSAPLTRQLARSSLHLAVIDGGEVLFLSRDGDEGHWVTISGTHVLIRGGKVVEGPAALKGKSAAVHPVTSQKGGHAPAGGVVHSSNGQKYEGGHFLPTHGQNARPAGPLFTGQPEPAVKQPRLFDSPAARAGAEAAHRAAGLYDADKAATSRVGKGLFGQSTTDAATGSKQGEMFDTAKPADAGEKVKAHPNAVDPRHTGKLFEPKDEPQTTVPHLAGVNGQDELAKHYAGRNAVISSHRELGNEGYDVVLPDAKRIHRYRSNVQNRVGAFGFAGEGYHDEHSDASETAYRAAKAANAKAVAKESPATPQPPSRDQITAAIARHKAAGKDTAQAVAAAHRELGIGHEPAPKAERTAPSRPATPAKEPAATPTKRDANAEQAARIRAQANKLREKVAPKSATPEYHEQKAKELEAEAAKLSPAEAGKAAARAASGLANRTSLTPDRYAAKLDDLRAYAANEKAAMAGKTHLQTDDFRKRHAELAETHRVAKAYARDDAERDFHAQAERVHRDVVAHSYTGGNLAPDTTVRQPSSASETNARKFEAQRQAAAKTTAGVMRRMGEHGAAEKVEAEANMPAAPMTPADAGRAAAQRAAGVVSAPMPKASMELTPAEAGAAAAHAAAGITPEHRRLAALQDKLRGGFKYQIGSNTISAPEHLRVARGGLEFKGKSGWYPVNDYHAERMAVQAGLQKSKSAVAHEEIAKRHAAGLAIHGNTYEHRQAIRNAGGMWDENRKVWLAPDKETHAKLQAMVTPPAAAAQPAPKVSTPAAPPAVPPVPPTPTPSEPGDWRPRGYEAVRAAHAAYGAAEEATSRFIANDLLGKAPPTGTAERLAAARQAHPEAALWHDAESQENSTHWSDPVGKAEAARNAKDILRRGGSLAEAKAALAKEKELNYYFD